MKKLLIGCGLTAALLVGFQNCTGTHWGSVATLSSVSGKGCETVLMNAYLQTYYNNWFRSESASRNCIPCHDSGGAAGASREFAHADFTKAFASFQAIGRARIEANGLNAAHQAPHTGPHNQGLVDAARDKWIAAETAAAQCGGVNEVKTVKKSAPANVYTTNPGDNANTAWPRLTWDLDADIPGQPNQIHVTVSIEVRRFMANTPPTAIGYQFRNPTVTSKTGETYRLQSLMMDLNDSNYLTFTAYNLFDFNFNQTTATNLAPNMGFAAAPTASLTVSNTDQFALRFASIAPAPGALINTPGTVITGPGGQIPTRVTFADLQSANPTTGVFSRACNSCHNNNNRQGSLNLQDYNAAVAVAQTIRSRMNNAGNPMPPTGLLNGNDRAVVDVWINGGTPQN